MLSINGEQHMGKRSQTNDYHKGQWDMFELISSAWYGKQCYFLESNTVVYSRASNSYLTINEAFAEFLSFIGDDGSI